MSNATFRDTSCACVSANWRQYSTSTGADGLASGPVFAAPGAHAATADAAPSAAPARKSCARVKRRFVMLLLLVPGSNVLLALLVQAVLDAGATTGAVEDRSSAEAAIWRGEVVHERRDLLRPPRAPQWDLGDQWRRLVLRSFPVARRVDQRRRHRVHQYAALRQLERQRARQPQHARLRRRVRYAQLVPA